MAFEKDATVDTITLVKPMGMNVHERKIKREKKEYIIATLKNDDDGYIFSLCNRSEKRYNSSRLVVIHLIYSSRNLVPW